MMTSNYSIINDSGFYSNNVVFKKAEVSPARFVSENLVIYALVGASLFCLFAEGNCELKLNPDNYYPVVSDNYLSCAANVEGTVIDVLMEENINKINRISAFEDDWDGNGALSFSKDSIDMFTKVIHSLRKQPQIAPTGKESIIMQYKSEDNSVLVFDVSLGRVEMAYVPKGNFEDAKTGVFTDDFIKYMNKYIDEYYVVG